MCKLCWHAHVSSNLGGQVNRPDHQRPPGVACVHTGVQLSESTSVIRCACVCSVMEVSKPSGLSLLHARCAQTSLSPAMQGACGAAGGLIPQCVASEGVC